MERVIIGLIIVDPGLTCRANRFRESKSVRGFRDTHSVCPPKPQFFSVADLKRGTPGSAGLDLCSTARAVLTSDMGVQALPTGVYGPLPSGSWGLLLGRSSVTLRGIHIFPGVIDNDFQGEIKVMAACSRGVLVIPQGERIAQLILLPLPKCDNETIRDYRGQGGFGSTGSSSVFWTAELDQCPELKLVIEGKNFKGLLDTGADTSVISAQFWPSTWPLQDSATQVSGIGGSPSVQRSTKILKWQDLDGQSGHFQPYIIKGLPVNLWGQDILESMGAVLTTHYPKSGKKLHKWEWREGQGLGKTSQGSPSPISVPDPSQGMSSDQSGDGTPNLS